MPGISAVKTTIPFSRKGFSASAYWATLISTTVENAAPADVVLTFPEEGTSVAADITCTVNGVARAVSSASWTGGVWTVVLASAVEYGDVVVVTFVPSGGTANVINNVLTYAALLTSIGDGSGVSTLRMEVSADITVTLGTNAKFYSDSGGTADESATWSLTAGALRTIYLKCTTGTATMTFSDVSKVTKWGNDTTDGWTSGTGAALVTATPGKLVNLLQLRISGRSTLIGVLPTGLTNLELNGTFVSWTYNGALPTGIQVLLLISNLIAWTYNAALPTGIQILYLIGNSIVWTYNGMLPNALLVINIAGILIDWTGLNVGNSGNIGTFLLSNYRINKMSSTDMITLLTQLTNRTGPLPTTITINDYADYASPPAEVVAAVNALKLAKSITTVNLGA